MATPSLLTQGLPFSAMPTAYNTGKELSAPGGAWCDRAIPRGKRTRGSPGSSVTRRGEVQELHGIKNEMKLVI